MKKIILAAGAAAGFAMAGMTATAVAQTPAGEADYSTGKTPITLNAGAAQDLAPEEPHDSLLGDVDLG